MKTRTNASISIKESTFPLKDRFSFLWLLIGLILLVFSNGRWMVPLADWIAPAFLLRFLRTQRVGIGLLAGYLVNAIAFYFQWAPAFKDAGEMFGLYTAAFGLLVFLPYAVDRLLRPFVRGFTASLVFPLAWVTTEYLLHLILPLGTFFSLAYTQHMNLPLLQVMSITGLWGVTFLVAWFSSVTNYVWENGFQVGKAWKGAAAYGSVMLTVLFFGGLRLALFPPSGQTVQVSVLTSNIEANIIPDDTSDLHARLVAGTLTETDRQEMTQTMEQVNNDLLERTQVQAWAGSKIITWSEYNASVFEDDEQAFLDRCRQLARDEQIYLVFPLLTIQPDPNLRPVPNQLVENKSVMITPEGEIAYEYVKANLLIGWEMEYAIPGPGQILTIDSPYGRLSSVICLDMDFPNFMRQAGQQGVDIMLSGAVDGSPATGGNPYHSIMASYRAIEEGFSLARGGDAARDLAVDYQGHILGRSDFFTTEDHTVIAQLPIEGTRTLYSALGDFFPWLCMLCLAGFAITPLIRRLRRKYQAI
ncbi:MAG: nitrilase-related carbon-nitrogen hydrolase [Chloroflexota bacterium]